MKLDRKPRPMTNAPASVDGWWYENAKSIDVYLHDRVEKKTFHARIKRKDLEAWLKRTKTPPAKGGSE